jgi:putative sigma-54 modulation protein
MEIKIESPHFALSSLLNDYVNEKVSKLERLNERLIRSEVCLKLDKSATDDNKICEIRVVGPQKNLFASARCMTFEDAIIETIHAIEKQLRKLKTKKEKGREKIQVTDSTADESID